MAVVSVRLEDKDLAWLRSHGLSPGSFARAAVHEAIRQQEIKDARAFLDQHRIAFDRPVADLIREDRDSH
jgi:hypothetical protein